MVFHVVVVFTILSENAVHLVDVAAIPQSVVQTANAVSLCRRSPIAVVGVGMHIARVCVGVFVSGNG